MPEQVSDARHHRDPDGRAQKVEESESLPAHAQYAGQRSGKSAQAEDEAGKENGDCAAAGEHLLAAFQRRRRNPKDTLIAIKERTPAIVADGLSQITAKRGGASGYHDDPSEMELVFGIG